MSFKDHVEHLPTFEGSLAAELRLRLQALMKRSDRELIEGVRDLVTLWILKR